MAWKRHRNRPYETVSSTSSADSVAASDSPLPTSSDYQGQPMPDSTTSSPQIRSKPENDQDQPMPNSTTSSPQIRSKPEDDQDQPMPDSTSSRQIISNPEDDWYPPGYVTDVCSYDADLQQRECSRRSGNNKPVLQWENMSREYYQWFKQMEVHNSEPVIENLEMHEPSADVILPLLRYQKEWLSWGLKQEASEMKGGILADEMGMGKTIQAIALVLTAGELNAESDVSSSSSKGNNKCTLVICPVSAMLQWQREIEMHTANGCLKILVYHGQDRMKGELDFSQYDFVITGYGTVETDYRKYVMPPKELCEHCGRGFTSLKRLSKHQRYL